MEALFTLLQLFTLNFIFLLASASLWSACPIKAAVPPPVKRGTSWPLAFLCPLHTWGPRAIPCPSNGAKNQTMLLMPSVICMVLSDTLVELQAEKTMEGEPQRTFSLVLISTHFYPGRRPKPEIVASKEQQIQRDDPGERPQSSSQPDHSRLSRKPPAAPRAGATASEGSLLQ